jgi:PBSX family phage terminase large subunit
MATLFKGNFGFSISQKTASLYGRKIWLEGANDERAENKIRGITLTGAYCDELTLFPEGFYLMLLSRLSVPGARLIATTNPDSPAHWVKSDIIDNDNIADQRSLWHFTLDDDDIGLNDPRWIKDIKASYTGVFYARYILGEWVLAEGLVYQNATDALVEPQEGIAYEEYQISCDYGIHNPTVYGLFGRHDNSWFLLNEYYHSGRQTNQPKTDEEYYADLEKFAGELPIKRILIDPSASSFITLIRRKGKFRVKQADNDVIPGISMTATALNNGKLKVFDTCKHAIAEFNAYSWDEKSVDDKPIKENDHMMDAIRYFVYTNKLCVPARKPLV